MITLCIPTLRRFDTLKVCVDSALSGSLPVDKILVIDNSAGQLSQQLFYDLPVSIHTPSYNLGCSQSWNKFMCENDDQLIIANDDVVFHHDCVAEFKQHFDQGAVFIGANHANTFSLFSLRKDLYQHIGPFDEQFWPAYFEDNDYAKRMENAGVPITYFDTILYDHVGSATIAKYSPSEMTVHHEQFQANQQRYISKWGALP